MLVSDICSVAKLPLTFNKGKGPFQHLDATWYIRSVSKFHMVFDGNAINIFFGSVDRNGIRYCFVIFGIDPACLCQDFGIAVSNSLEGYFSADLYLVVNGNFNWDFSFFRVLLEINPCIEEEGAVCVRVFFNIVCVGEGNRFFCSIYGCMSDDFVGINISNLKAIRSNH